MKLPLVRGLAFGAGLVVGTLREFGVYLLVVGFGLGVCVALIVALAPVPA